MEHLKRHWSIFALIFIVGLAAFLRLYALGSIPNGLYIDEVAIGVDALSLAKTGHDMHGGPWFTTVFPSYGDYKLPVYIWLAAISVRLFGATDFAVRLPSAIAGIGTVMLVYALAIDLFAKEKHVKFIALLSAAMIAIMPWSILFSRTGFEAHVGQALLLASAWMMLRAQKRPWLLVLSSVLGALAVYTYFSVRFVFPVVLVGIFLFQIEKKHWKKQVLYCIGCLALFGLLVLPMGKSPYYAAMQSLRFSTKNILNNTDFVTATNRLRELGGNTVMSRLIYHRDVFMAKELLRHFADHLNFSYLFVSGDTNLRHSTGETGILLFGMLPPFVIGLFTLARKHKKLSCILLLWYVAALLPASVPYDTPHALRSLNALGVLALVLGVGGTEITVTLCRGSMVKKFLLASLMVFLGFNFFSFWHNYTYHHPQRSASAWAEMRKELGLFIQERKNTYEKIQITADDHLFLWVVWYGGFDIREVQHAPSISYIKPVFANVVFQPLSKVSWDWQRSLVIGQSSELETLPDNHVITTSPSEAFSYVETR